MSNAKETVFYCFYTTYIEYLLRYEQTAEEDDNIFLLKKELP